MNRYIFTFGSGQLYAGFYQPIYANDGMEARVKMLEIHGLKWGFQYTDEEWKAAKLKYGALEQPLQAIYCNDAQESS